MRLSKRMQSIIKMSIFESFGNVGIYLFGSRVDDMISGGDIDLAIDADISKEEFKKNKINFLANMIRLGFDLKIDLVSYKQDDLLLASEIRNNSVKL